MPSITAPAPLPSSPSVSNWREAGFAVYVHWPFCQAKCPYCDFNSHVTASIDHDAWRTAMVAEIRNAAELTPGRRVRSVFFGGGTPSLMAPETVGAILDAIADAWEMEPDVELTMEANPTSVDAARFQGYRAAGVNRLSLGVQALNDRDLRRLGRLHSAEDARRAFNIAVSTFPRVSADLIYARQDQTLAEWRAELAIALSLGLDHLSLYQLTIEDGTVFGERFRRGLLKGLPDEDLGADLFDATQSQCATAGLPAYEVSNHAKVGAESRHNMVYWRAGDWVGIGPGAVGRITHDAARWASNSEKAPGAWMASMNDQGTATRWDPTEDHAAEYLMMGLRLREGISRARLQRLGGRMEEQAVATLCDDGLLRDDGERLATTDRGRPLLNAILREIS